jgi:hypothetical protein
MRSYRVIALAAALALAACGGSKSHLPGPGDGTTDGTDDASMDVVSDGDDASTDTGLDTPADTGWDADSTDPPVDPMPEPHPDGTPDTDTDGDTILDIDEGGGSVDTDGDGVPDTEDTDSDGDGIPDSVEAGDAEPMTPPVDSDFDGIPDFRDLDSDADTIRDSDEGVADVDGDGIPNYRDLDSDGDYLQDFFEAGDSDLMTGPFDHDGDGTPDYLDLDSDNDTILDVDEGNLDTDTDGTYDYLDLDSDGDTIPDREEAGDYDPSTPPVNCDTDSLPNYRDTDSDNDGIADWEELTRGTDLCDPDTDGDGVSDLVEIAYGSDPLDGSESPRTYGDFVFEVPYMAAPSPTVDTLVFSTDLQMADVYFTLDSSGSMGGEIANLLSSLRTTVVPGIDAAIPDVWYGVGRFEDCRSTYCSNDMCRLQEMTSSIPAVEAALTGWTTCGGYEPYTHDLYAIASGDVSPFVGWVGVFPSSWTCTAPGAIGWPCFRTGAVPIVIQFGDEDFDANITYCTPSRSYAQAIAAMNAINAKYIGVNSGSSHADMVTVATGTGSVDSGGVPLVFDIPSTGTGLGTQVVDAVTHLANNVPIRVDAIASDDPSDSVDAVAEFVDRIQTNTSGSSIWDPILSEWRVCTSTVPTATPGTPPTVDYFSSVLPGQPVCFDIYPAMNSSVPPLTTPQIFRAVIDVIGDLFTPLDSRDVYFLVPPEIPGGN